MNFVGSYLKPRGIQIFTGYNKKLILFNMSKRSVDNSMDTSSKPKQTKHWSLGLLESMKDPECIVKQTNNVVVISDKYPKAKLHYLVLPYKEINSIYKLTKEHVPLLEEFNRLFMEIKNEHKEFELRAGFHAVPSMQRLHMHIISTDMVSPCLKTKAHWNNFTTSFFRPYQDVICELKDTGSIKKISPELHKSLLGMALQCNKCSFKPKNMPQLKEHLLTHTNK